jgi:hypothetical protein
MISVEIQDAVRYYPYRSYATEHHALVGNGWLFDEMYPLVDEVRSSLAGVREVVFQALEEDDA